MRYALRAALRSIMLPAAVLDRLSSAHCQALRHVYTFDGYLRMQDLS